MAAKQYIDLADLALFKQLNDSATAQAIATAEARSLHTVAIDGTTLKFYREEEPVGSSTPAYSITLPETDLSNYFQKFAVTGDDDGKLVQVTPVSDGQGGVVATLSKTNIHYSDIALSADLAAVATSGDADDVSYDNTDSGLTSTDVQGAIDELATASAGGVASKTIYLQDETSGQADYAKVYKIYQGANSPSAQTDPAALIGTINIPKDLVVSGGSVVTVEDGQDSEGDSTSVADGTYIKLRIQNQSAPLYINVADLIDDYTAQQNATQVQLAISATNEISATIVAGSIGTTELADDSVTAAKVNIPAHYETNQTPGALNNPPVVISVTTTDGQVSGVEGYIVENTFEPYGATSSAIADLDATPSQTAGADGLALSLTEVDGVVTAISGSIASGTYDAYGAASDVQDDITGTASDTSTDLTLYGLRAYADAQASAGTESVPLQDIRDLFASPSV